MASKAKRVASKHPARGTKGRSKTARRVANDGRVEQILNGQPMGSIDPTGLSISQAANNLAKAHGIKSYSILLNGGMKVMAEEAGNPLAGATSIEVFAKETRG